MPVAAGCGVLLRQDAGEQGREAFIALAASVGRARDQLCPSCPCSLPVVAATCPCSLPVVAASCPCSLPVVAASCPCSLPVVAASCPCSLPVVAATCPCSLPVVAASCPCSLPVVAASCPCSLPVVRTSCPCSLPVVRTSCPCSLPVVPSRLIAVATGTTRTPKQQRSGGRAAPAIRRRRAESSIEQLGRGEAIVSADPQCGAPGRGAAAGAASGVAMSDVDRIDRSAATG
jgi:hypothetical protein